MQVITVWSDIGCPWAHATVSRLHRYRERLGVDVRLDHRCFPLELFNRRPTPKHVLDAEMPVVGAIEPDAGWQVWQRREWEWPVTMLPALEAVQAAKAQGLEAAEQLDRGLRVAFFGESRCISLRPVILEVAGRCPAVDVDSLATALDDGRARRAVIDDFARAEADGVQGSPHVFTADGRDWHNPGVRMHWEGEHGSGFPVVDADDPGVYEEILKPS